MNWTVLDMYLFIAELILIQINFSPGNSFSKTTITCVLGKIYLILPILHRYVIVFAYGLFLTSLHNIFVAHKIHETRCIYFDVKLIYVCLPLDKER